jgi:hypothetical protein
MWGLQNWPPSDRCDQQFSLISKDSCKILFYLNGMEIPNGLKISWAILIVVMKEMDSEWINTSF